MAKVPNVVAVLATAVSVLATAGHADLRVGVMAPQGEERALARWSAFGEALSDGVGQPIEIVPVTANGGVEAFGAGEIDILLGNPVQTAVVVDTMDAVPLASLVSATGERFAGVIVVAATSEVNTSFDLWGQQVATLGDWAAGGFLFQSAFLMDQGLPHPGDFGERIIASNQRELVAMVLDGRADAAFVRTGIIEAMVSDGSLDADALRVIDDQRSADSEVHRTTPWYPEWFISAQATLSPDVMSQIEAGVMAMGEDSPAIQQAGVAGFIDPLDVSQVVQAMQIVGVSPYN